MSVLDTFRCPGKTFADSLQLVSVQVLFLGVYATFLLGFELQAVGVTLILLSAITRLHFPKLERYPPTYAQYVEVISKSD